MRTDGTWTEVGPLGHGPAAVLFDMDGTLIDSERLWDQSLAEGLARLGGGELSTAARHDTIGDTIETSLRVLFREAGIPMAPELVDDTRTFLLERTAELYAAGLPWRPGAEKLLRIVQEAGWPTALVTNTGRVLADIVLDGIGREHFTVTVTGDEVAHAKPAPDPYLRAAELLGVPITQCLAVEDSPSGATAAEAAGAVVLVVPSVVAVPGGPSRVLRDSLVGMDVEDVEAAFAAVRAG